MSGKVTGIDLSKTKQKTSDVLFQVTLIDNQKISISADWKMKFGTQSYSPSMQYIIETWDEFTALTLERNEDETLLFIPKQSILFINKQIPENG